MRRLIMVLLGVAMTSWGCEDTNIGGGFDGGGAFDSGIDDSGHAGSSPNDLPLPAGLVSSAAAGGDVDVASENGDDQFLVVAYSVNKTASEAISFNVKVVATPAGTGSQESQLREVTPRHRSLRQLDPRADRLMQGQLQLERWRRQVALRASKARMMAPPVGQQFIQAESCQLSSQCGVSEVCLTSSQTCSTTVELDASEFPDKSGQYSAQVVAKGEHVAILVDSDVVDGVSSETVGALLQAFDEKIYPRDVALFGNPPLETGGSVLSTDRNGDGLVWVVLTPRVSGTTERVGFFFPTDFTEEQGSNRADILYAMPAGAPGVETQLSEVLFTMAHEFQHLLSFANKVYRPRVAGGTGTLEALWLDEGLSHLAEDLCGYGGANLLLLDQETLGVFSESSLVPPVDEQGNQIDSKSMRGMALLFLRYLFERKGGVSFGSDGSITDQGGAGWLHAVHNTSAQGRDAIDQTYGDFRIAFERWLLTMGLDNRGVTDSELLNYDDPITDPTPPGHAIGLRMDIALQDLEGEEVTLQRPLEDELAVGDTEGVVASTSGKFFLLSGMQGSAKVTVTSNDSDFYFAVVKLN